MSSSFQRACRIETQAPKIATNEQSRRTITRGIEETDPATLPRWIKAAKALQ